MLGWTEEVRKVAVASVLIPWLIAIALGVAAWRSSRERVEWFTWLYGGLAVFFVYAGLRLQAILSS